MFVQDTPDEVPTFPTRLYTATIPENTQNAYVTTVQVCYYFDLATTFQILYLILRPQYHTNLFAFFKFEF